MWVQGYGVDGNHSLIDCSWILDTSIRSIQFFNRKDWREAGRLTGEYDSSILVLVN